MQLTQATLSAIAAFMGDVDHISTIDALNAALRKPLERLHIKHAICISAFGMPALQDRKPMFGFRDTDWLRHYRKHHYFKDDALPIQALALKDWGRPFWWSDFVAENALTDIQKRIFKEAFDFGLKEGVVIPIHAAANEDDTVSEFAYTSLGGSVQKSLELENILRMLMLAAHRTACRIYVKEARQSRTGFAEDPFFKVAPNTDFSKLTWMERQILNHYIDSDDLEAIAAAHSIKVSTVQTHLKNARRKFGFSSTKEMMVALLRHRILI